jgi:GNAT superfamily N-acetyltransferase
MKVLKMTDTSIRLRPIGEGDSEVLCRIYAETRTEEMKKVPHWSPEMVNAFLKSQFELQHEYYQKNYVGGYFWMIEKQGQSIGRLYLHPDFQNRGVRIIDIALLPVWRNRGIGQCILKDVMSAAAALNRPLTIHVESFNPAMQLYKKLGFKKISETNGVYHLLEWKAAMDEKTPIN